MAMGRNLVVAATILLCFAAGIYAAGIDPEPMSAADATRFAQRALAESGVRGATFTGKAEADTFTPSGSKPVAVWRVSARIGDDTVVLFIEQVGDQVLNLDDQIAPGRHVLSSAQFEALGRFRHDPVGDRARNRQFLPAVAAGGLLGLAATALAIVAGRGLAWTNPAKPEEPSRPEPEPSAELLGEEGAKSRHDVGGADQQLGLE